MTTEPLSAPLMYNLKYNYISIFTILLRQSVKMANGLKPLPIFLEAFMLHV